MDTLKTEFTYSSPIQNPLSIEYYEGYFWIANLLNPKIYKLNSEMILIDSIELHRSHICGICFKENKLLISVDESVKDIASPANYLPYRIYGINPTTKSITDSSLFKLDATGRDTGMIYGFGVQNDTFLLTLNKGWSSGIYSINSEALTDLKSYLPLSGLTIIANDIWGIRRSDNGRTGHFITSLTRGDSLMIEIGVNGSDIAYDGTNIYVCIPEQSSIVKLISTAVAVRNIQTKFNSHEPQFTSKCYYLNIRQIDRNVNSLVTLNGRITESFKKHNGQFGNQVFIFKHDKRH